MRLNVFLSHNGICSRRKAFDLVKSGRVKVNGKPMREPSLSVDPVTDVVTIDGKQVKPKTLDYIILNKPAGYVTTRAVHPKQKSIFELLPESFGHCVPAGRLDKDTEGLLLLTNDGDLVYKITHPKHLIDKIYLVRAEGLLNDGVKQKLEQGVVLDGKKTAPAKINDLKCHGGLTEFLITIHEGRKRQIRVMLGCMGHKVIFLKRLQQGPLRLGKLKRGKWRMLKREEINLLRKL